MDIDADERNALTHYGILRKSGRYPWGSGETPHERARGFLDSVAELRKQGIDDADIARGFEMTTPMFRANITTANEVKKEAQRIRVQRLKEHGLSNVEVGKKMGINESSVRALLKEINDNKEAVVKATAETLRHQVAKKNYIDIGKGVDIHMNVAPSKFKAAVAILKDEGYGYHYVKVPQLGTGKETTVTVLSAPGVPYGEVYRNRDKIQQIHVRSPDGGLHYSDTMEPISISSKRVKVRYAEEGGADADGVIYVRPGVKNVSLGKSQYAQVRISVDNTHYLKGMAMYKDDLPEGTDLLFNTNKSDTGNKLDALKKIDRVKNPDPTDPFGSQISDQIREIGSDGKPRLSSVMNIVNHEGTWDDWSKTLSSQMLSKQKPALAQHQLDITYDGRKSEFESIMGLNNPTLKKYMLEKFAESTDASAVHLKAAHLPRQATKVILPVNSLKENEVYAPTFNHGERVALIRFPHGGRFEIPELVVNNRHPEAKKLLGNAPDAIGIHSKVAEKLSGADFDGDTVLVIPNNLRKIQTEPSLPGLIGFDPKMYKIPEGSNIPKMTPKQKGLEMGKISNLITDMTIKGAPNSEIERAVKHSMVVIDAEKHGLNWKQSAKDNGIAALKKKYQGGADKGASTLISRAKSEVRVNDRQLRSKKDGGPIDPKTGKLVYVETGKEFSPGKLKTEKSTKLAETDDARTLISDQNTKIENVYANHSNRLKALANQARKESLHTGDIVRSPSAAKVYAEEVKELEIALREAKSNAPRERAAQIIANAVLRQKKDANPDMDKAELKKVSSKALLRARTSVGATKDRIVITPRQWEAIQAGAISKTRLLEILENTDLDKVKELATPKDKPVMSEAMRTRAALMLRNDNYSLADVAKQLGVSVSTLTRSLSGEGDE